MFRKAFVTRAAVHMGVKETGMQTGYRGTYKWPLNWDREQVHMRVLHSNQKSISMPQDGNRLGEKRVGALRSQVRWLSRLLTRWCMMAQSSCDAHVISEGSHVTQGRGGVFQPGP